ncbi:MAG: hypothetical protein RRB13_14420 [bacterium]|nr:hypothetical protein [bacterium]
MPSQRASKTRIKEELTRLLADPEGVVTLLAGGLMISDFDNPEEALAEALKAYNANRGYFERLIQKAHRQFSK